MFESAHASSCTIARSISLLTEELVFWSLTFANSSLLAEGFITDGTLYTRNHEISPGNNSTEIAKFQGKSRRPRVTGKKSRTPRGYRPLPLSNPSPITSWPLFHTLGAHAHQLRFVATSKERLTQVYFFCTTL